MTAADKLRELLASRPAMPNTEELVRWWRTSAELLPALLEQPKVLTTGRLDGLVITPIRDGDEIRFLEFTVDTLSGLRLVLEAGAARELCEALGVILGNATPQGDLDGLRTELDAARVALSKQRAVTPAFILEQRAKGWPAVHPEDYCHRCGAANMSWYTDRQTWLEATSAWAAETGREGICCPRCFAEMHKEQTGKSIAWLVAGPEFERAIQYAENMAGAAIAPQGCTPTERIRLAAQCALRARNIERAAVDVLKQEVRELEQQRDHLRAELDRATGRAPMPGGTLLVGDKEAPLEVIGRTAEGVVTLKVTDPAMIAMLKKGTEPVSIGYLMGEPAVPVDDGSRCAVCGWLMADPEAGVDAVHCAPGDCSMRPRPDKLYAPERAKREAEELRQRALRERMEAGHA